MAHSLLYFDKFSENIKFYKTRTLSPPRLSNRRICVSKLTRAASGEETTRRPRAADRTEGIYTCSNTNTFKCLHTETNTFAHTKVQDNLKFAEIMINGKKRLKMRLERDAHKKAIILT